MPERGAPPAYTGRRAENPDGTEVRASAYIQNDLDEICRTVTRVYAISQNGKFNQKNLEKFGKVYYNVFRKGKCLRSVRVSSGFGGKPGPAFFP